jgi:hypothetical protein
MIKKELYRKDRKFCCEDYSLIENYDKAIADTVQTWHCHHRLETHTSDGEKRLVPITRDELIAMNMYYNRPASELIFLTPSEHTTLHDVFFEYHTEETKEKIKKWYTTHTVDKSYMQTDEYKKAVSEAKKKTHIVTRGSTGMHWYNNGIENIFAFECPDGFVKGKKDKKSEEELAENKKQSHKKYDNQLCDYNGEILTLHALRSRFSRAGIKHSTQEAKKYLIEQEVA